MPLRLDIKRKLSARSDRVKSLDFHPTEPWLLASLYNGNVYIWNYENQSLVKTFEVTELPVRIAKFIPRKNWIIAGADDMQIRVFNYNTHEKVAVFEAHTDYIRSIAVHPTQPYVLTSSDDMTIKLWDWENGWKNIQTFEGHSHYVMQVVFNPKDSNTFASASLDRTVKIWSIGSPVPNFTLEAHEKGVNCLDYYNGGEKPYLVTGSDDKLVKVWDYQNKSCVQTLEGHTQNVSVVCFHPELPIIISGSEDGTVRLWHSNTYRLENTLNYGMERVWAICYLRGSNDVGLGYDEGTIVIKLGREEPAVSMDNTGKIVWARHNEIQTTNVKSGAEMDDTKDGERIPLPVKEFGSCEIYPQTLQHNPNGRFVVVCGDGEYIIYTSVAWRNKSFGSALEFVWSADANEYAIRETSSKVKLFKNFKEKKVVKPNFSAEGIFGGACLGIRSGNFLCFYDWENTNMIRKIDVTPKNVYWSESGELLAICCEGAFYILKYNKEAVEKAGSNIPEDGIEDAFEVVTEIQESVKTACWTGDCFIYTNSNNRLNYYVGGQINTIAHFDKVLYLLGYIPQNNKLYLVDKDLNVIGYSLSVTVLEFQTAILRGDDEAARSILPNIPSEQRNKIARFLETQGYMEYALEVSNDNEHKFELAVQLKKLEIAFEIAQESESDQKWKQLSDLTLQEWKFDLSEECMKKAKDFSGLLLLYTSTSSSDKLESLGKWSASEGHNNIAFICFFLIGKVDECLQILVSENRFAEAALMSRTYAPSKISDMVHLWKKSFANRHRKLADALADPSQYANLFPEFEKAVKIESLLESKRNQPIKSTHYDDYRGIIETDPLNEEDVLEDDQDLLEETNEEIQDYDEEEVSQRSEPTSRPLTRNKQEDEISENFSVEVNTTGTNSNKGDDLDDLSSIGNEQEQEQEQETAANDDFDDF